MDTEGDGAQNTELAVIAISGDNNLDAVDRTFKYLSRHGLIVAAIMQSFYRALRLLRAYASGGLIEFKYTLALLPFSPFRSWLSVVLTLDGSKAALSLPLPFGWHLPIYAADLASWKKVRRVGIILFSFLSFWLIVTWFFTALRSLPQRLGLTILRCWSTTLTAAFRSVPLLIALLVILFSTGDAWRLYGNESIHRFELLVIIISILAIAAMVMTLTRVQGGWRDIATQQKASSLELPEMVKRTPADQLVQDGVKPLKLSSKFYASRWLRINIYFLFWFTLIAHLFSVALLVFLAFILIGMIAVSAAATKMLLPNEPVVTLWHIHVLGDSFILTRPLLMLSALFGCVAALTYATVNLQDDEGLNRFLDFSLVYYNRTFSALRYYLGAIFDLQQKLPWKHIAAQLDKNNRTAVLELLEDFLKRASPRVITGILDVARKNALTGWAGDQGLDLLASIPCDRLVALPSEDVDFVLTAAASDPTKAAIIQSVRERLSAAAMD